MIGWQGGGEQEKVATKETEGERKTSAGIYKAYKAGRSILGTLIHLNTSYPTDPLPSTPH